MTPGLPLVTIITPTYNRADYLVETIESVLGQNYPNLEYIVLDDGSKDRTSEILEKYAGRIIWDKHPNMGETRTVNKGFDMASGEFVCVVNSDDPLLPGAITDAVMALQRWPEALAVYPDWDEIGPHGELVHHRRLPDYNILNMLTTFKVSMGPGVFIRRRAIKKFEARDLQFKYVGDLEYWFRLAIHGNLIHIPKVLATHRVHPEAASVTDRGAQMADELVQIVHKLYSQADLPWEVARIRKRVLSKAHSVATFYCGNDRRARYGHLMMALKLDPINSPVHLARYIWLHVKLFWKFLKARVPALRGPWKDKP